MNGILQAIKQNEVSIYATTWMPLKVIMLAEKEARRKKKKCILHKGVKVLIA